jgi:hypothetical protein
VYKFNGISRLSTGGGDFTDLLAIQLGRKIDIPTGLYKRKAVDNIFEKQVFHRNIKGSTTTTMS